MSLDERIEVLEKMFPGAIRRRSGTLVDFDFDKIVDAVSSAAERVGYGDREISEKIAMKTIGILYGKNIRIPTVDEINKTNVESAKELGYDDIAYVYSRYSEDRKKVRETLKILGEKARAKDTTDGFLMVASSSDEVANPWDRTRIVESLIEEADAQLKVAKSVAKSIENNIVLSISSQDTKLLVTTDQIREMAYAELLKRGLRREADRYRNFTIPRANLESILFDKNKENSNIAANNPEAVNFTLAGRISKEYAFSSVFTPDVADGHTNAKIHAHDSDMSWRVYCSGHSVEYIKKYGLSLENLQTASSPAKHTVTLTGHINTFLASMQTYYAGALGLGYLNILYAPLVENDLKEIGERKIEFLESILEKCEKDGVDGGEGFVKLKSNLEKLKKDPVSALTDEEVDRFVKQQMQYLIYSCSQNAFSRGGQTLFLDFNMHTGVPKHLKDTLAIGPSGKYMLERDGEKIYLEERKLEEKTSSGYSLIELVDPTTGKVVMKERTEMKIMMKEKEEKEEEELVQDKFLNENEKLVTYADYDKLSKKISRVALSVWRKGDKDGVPFAFPKCDIHVNGDTFKDEEQLELLRYACLISSENGSPYFVFDRDEVTLAACCRLRTTITDNYVLKHPESMRFCGFQNVTINLPQAAYRAAKRGKKNLEGFLEEITDSMELAVKAHLQKKEFIEKLQGPDLPQWQTGKPSADGLPYIDLDEATYIIGLIGFNEAVQFTFGKELHELNVDERKSCALNVIAHMYFKAKEFGEKYNLKFSLEETPAESATRRLAKVDLENYPESREVIKGDMENDAIYYTNSIHFRADAPADLLTRIRTQSKFHPMIESGAIIHAFVGEKYPDPDSLLNLIEKIYNNTQCAQFVVSPEFTLCNECRNVDKGLLENCPECGSEDVDGITRIVGYYSKVSNWNKSKSHGELIDRRRGKESYDIVPVPISTESGYSDGFEVDVYGSDECEKCKGLLEDLENIQKRPEDYAKRHLELENAVLKEDLKVTYHNMLTEDGFVEAAEDGRINQNRIPVLVVYDKGKEVFRRDTKYGTDDLEDTVIAPKHYLEHLVTNGNKKI